MKNNFKQLAIIAIFFLANCSMAMNEKTTDLTILSNPPGAQIYIDGDYYGVTPKTLNIEPKKSTMQGMVIDKNQNQQSFEIETWYAVREGKEGKNCLLDSMGMMLVLPAFSFFSSYCRDFKQKEYFFETAQNSGKQNFYSPNNQQNNQNNYYDQY